MEHSIFMDKANEPTNEGLKAALNGSYKNWEIIRNFVFEKYPNGKEEWNFPGKKYGWSFRIKDKKRAIVYLLPRDVSFKVAFVFGQKATDQILESDINEKIKTELKNAKVYVEGRGVSIDIENELIIPDIKKLVEIKLAN